MSIEVSTWAELEACFTDNTAADIKLIADIDLNNEYPQGVTGFTYNASKVVIIDGEYIENGVKKRHIIRNLRTNMTTPQTIFKQSSGSATNDGTILKNIDFQNLILAGANFLESSDSYKMTVNNCRFTGSRTGTAYFMKKGSYSNASLTNCSFDLPWKGAGQSDLAPISLIYAQGISANAGASSYLQANYCRFVEKYTGWILPTNLRYDSPGRYYSFSAIKLNGCRVEGETTVPTFICYDDNYAYYSPFFYKQFASYLSPSQNVFDIRITCKDMHSSGTLVNKLCYGAFNGVISDTAVNESNVGIPLEDYNGTKYYFDKESSTCPNPIIASAAQMKNSAWLQSQGFDIV